VSVHERRARFVPWVLAAGVVLAAGAPVRAEWDMSSTAALTHTWSENSTYRSFGDNGDAISNLRLTGNLRNVQRRSTFEASYTPLAIFYRDHSNLNRLSHLATLREKFDISARSSLTASDSYFYSPEQGATPTAYNTPIVLTRYSDRRSNNANVAYNLQATRKSRYTFELRHQILSYGNPGLADSTGLTLTLRYDRDLTARAGLDCGISGGRTRFDREDVVGTDPNGNDIREPVSTEVDLVNVYVGGRLQVGRTVTLSARLGNNSVLPSDPNRPTTSGLQAEASAQWNLRRAQAQLGYHRGINTGSGTFDASETESVYGSLRWELARKLTTDIFGNRSDSRNASQGLGSRDVRTFSGGVRLDYRMTDSLSGLLAYTRNVQDSSVPSAPNLRFSAASIGLLARFD